MTRTKADTEEKKPKPFWKMYQVHWQFTRKLVGSIPANQNVLEAFLKARSPNTQPAGGKSLQELKTAVEATLPEEGTYEEALKQHLTVFQRVDGVCCMRADTVRAHLKDCSRVLSAEYVGKIRGELSFAVRFIRCTYLDPTQEWLPIVDNQGNPFPDPTGVKEKPIRTWNGSALKAFEYIEGAHLNFTIRILGGNFDAADLGSIMDYGGVHGYAGERGDGEGKYIYTIKELPE